MIQEYLDTGSRIILIQAGDPVYATKKVGQPSCTQQIFTGKHIYQSTVCFISSLLNLRDLDIHMRSNILTWKYLPLFILGAASFKSSLQF